jgi:hypothetical protein
VVRRKPRKSLTSADVAALAIGERDGVASRNRLLLPSIVYVTDQAVVFGEEAQTAAIRGERLDREAFVSPKQYLSTREAEELDEPLKSKIDPTGAYTARQLLALFLAHLLVQAGRAAKRAKVRGRFLSALRGQHGSKRVLRLGRRPSILSSCGRSPLPMTLATSCRPPKGFRTTSPARRWERR